MWDEKEPVWFTTEEGGDWIEWRHRGPMARHFNAIIFADGTAFDIVNGWRDTKYCPHCTNRRGTNYAIG